MHAAAPTRRDFLRGRTAKPAPLRPPWALPESAFTDACTRCGDCERACPQRILVRGDGGFPEVDFALGECTFCARCADACVASAFATTRALPWQARAAIGSECLTWHGVVCRSCADACTARALRFEHRAPQRVPVPAVDTATCTGCGACVAICPVGAIRVSVATAT